MTKPSQWRIAERFEHEIAPISGSRFLTTLVPAEDPEQVIAVQCELRQQHPHSRHVCFAYVGSDDTQLRWSDDGEPGKTAGYPMLKVLTGAHLSHVGALVVRYFGGVKLGTGGLVRAYTAAVREAVIRAELLPVVPTTRVRLSCPYALEPQLRYRLSQSGCEPLEAHYGGQGVQFEARLPEAELRQLREWLTQQPEIELRDDE